MPLDQSLTTKELIDVSAFIRFKEPWLFEFLRDEGLEFSSEILAVGRFDLNEDGREELFVAVIHPSDCGTGGCLMYVLERRDGDGPEGIGFVAWKDVRNCVVVGPVEFGSQTSKERRRSLGLPLIVN